ncbi:MAG: hypothetical protein GX821_05345 [Clostridiaceae bacterium]|nr:hypothetical protein [Clostridiaceae bacterium]
MTLSYRPFMEQVAKRLDALSSQQLRQLLIEWASNEHPDRRESFLDRLSILEPPTKPVNETAVLADKIQTFCQAVENGDYCTAGAGTTASAKNGTLAMKAGPATWMLTWPTPAFSC